MSFRHLPIALSSFIGRRHELGEVGRLLSATRLLTLTGPGGCGKTRLALQAAAELHTHADVVCWVEFAALTAAELVPATVARALRLPQEGADDPLDLLLQSLAARHVLLIFDNCEHVIEACAALAAALLQRCPNVRILATSREALLIDGETVWTVPPLSLSACEPTPQGAELDPVSLPLQSEAVGLFVERASAATPGFLHNPENASCIAEICRRLDGMPLAIELAAARTRALSVEQIAAWLMEPDEWPTARTRLLATQSRTAPRRHQSLQAALDWSYLLLTDEERVVLQHLAVFRGGCTLEAAQAVCVHECVAPFDLLEVLTRLIDKSLVIMRDQGGVARYGFLETVRQYAYDKLTESGNCDAALQRHLLYYLEQAEQAQVHFTGAAQLTSFQQIEQELDNLRVALERIVASRDDESFQTAYGLRLCSTLEIFWGSRGSPGEGVEWLRKLLAQPVTRTSALALARARALNALCTLEMLVNSDVTVVQAHAQEAYTLGQKVQDEQIMAAALRILSGCALRQGLVTDAQAFLESSLTLWRQLAERLGAAGQHGLGWTLLYQAAFAFRQDNFTEAMNLYQECAQIFQQVGDGNYRALALRGLGNARLRLGEIGTTRALFQESLQINLTLSSWRGIVACLTGIAATLVAKGDGRAAARLLGATETLLLNATTALSLTDRVQWDHTQQLIPSLLDEETLQAARAEGRTLTLQHIVDIALAPEHPATKGQNSSQLSSIPCHVSNLSPRERQVAVLLAQGNTNREIAEQLVVGVKSVETYVTRILNKLGLSSRLQIALWAVEHGLQAPTETLQ